MRSSESVVATAAGPARVVTVPAAGQQVGVLALGHGAGGGIEAGDLSAVAAAASAAGWAVLLVEQPWRVAGRKVAAPPAHLDRCWLEVLDAVAPQLRGQGRFVLGGRSAGARVACRTATRLGADGVVALAFPLHPPGRPERSRAAELLGAGVPTLVVQGARDAFGGPDEIAAAVAGAPSAVPVEVTSVAGTHALTTDVTAVADAVVRWLAR